jgi:hypothetical protein
MSGVAGWICVSRVPCASRAGFNQVCSVSPCPASTMDATEHHRRIVQISDSRRHVSPAGDHRKHQTPQTLPSASGVRGKCGWHNCPRTPGVVEAGPDAKASLGRTGCALADVDDIDTWKEITHVVRYKEAANLKELSPYAALLRSFLLHFCHTSSSPTRDRHHDYRR